MFDRCCLEAVFISWHVLSEAWWLRPCFMGLVWRYQQQNMQVKDRPKRMKIHKIRNIHKIHEIHEIHEIHKIHKVHEIHKIREIQKYESMWYLLHLIHQRYFWKGNIFWKQSGCIGQDSLTLKSLKQVYS